MTKVVVGMSMSLDGIAGPKTADEDGMAVVDPELERHRRTWIGFTRLMKYAIATIVVILAGMAIFLT